jgi:CheY-like chemotaxis protein
MTTGTRLEIVRRVICFTEDATFASLVQQSISSDFEVVRFPAAYLNWKVREQVGQVRSQLILLELMPSFDNAHLFMFLRTESTTRNLPIIFVSNNPRHQFQAEVFGANGFMLRESIPTQLPKLLTQIEASNTLQERVMAR